MKKILNFDIKTILIILLSLIIAFLTLFKKAPDQIIVSPKDKIIVKTKTDTVYKTKTITKTIKGNDIYHEKIVEVKKEIPIYIDTNKVITSFYDVNLYKDTINFDDNNSIVLIDEISQNKIKNRTWTTHFTDKIVTNTVTIREPNRNQLYFGVMSGIERKTTYQIPFVSVGLVLKTKKDKMVNLNVGVSNNNTNLVPFISAGLFWKIKLK